MSKENSICLNFDVLYQKCENSLKGFQTFQLGKPNLEVNSSVAQTICQAPPKPPFSKEKHNIFNKRIEVNFFTNNDY